MSVRRKNPASFDLDNLMETMPAATVGSLAARWATGLAGPLDDGKPGIKHAIAIWIASHFGAQMVGQLFGSSAKGEYARIGAIAFGGDLFARKHLLAESEWATKNLYLGDEAYMVPDYSEGADLNGFEQTSALGDSFMDAMGNRYVQTAQGWALAGAGGMGAQVVQGEDGQLYQLMGDGSGGELVYPPDYDEIMEVSGFQQRSPIGGFQQQSPLGFTPAGASHTSSFGYA